MDMGCTSSYPFQTGTTNRIRQLRSFSNSNIYIRQIKVKNEMMCSIRFIIPSSAVLSFKKHNYAINPMNIQNYSYNFHYSNQNQNHYHKHINQSILTDLFMKRFHNGS
jgi:hypothetical protein